MIEFIISEAARGTRDVHSFLLPEGGDTGIWGRKRVGWARVFHPHPASFAGMLSLKGEGVGVWVTGKWNRRKTQMDVDFGQGGRDITTKARRHEEF
jgi:hypothetical protein